MNKRDLWFENALLALVLGVLVFLYAAAPAPEAQAAGGGWETDGVMALTTSGGAERLVLIDTNKKNICIYRMIGTGKFRLVGARSYKYDLDMKETANTAVENSNGVTYIQVKQMIEAAAGQ